MTMEAEKPYNDGRHDWHKYAAEFTSTDGRFAFNIYAISDEHAQMMLQDLKETAVIVGRTIGTVEAGK